MPKSESNDLTNKTTNQTNLIQMLPRFQTTNEQSIVNDNANNLQFPIISNDLFPFVNSNADYQAVNNHR